MAGHLLPVSEETWLVSAEDTVLSGVETAVLLRSGGVWEGLARFHGLVLDYLDLEIRAAAREARSRLGRKLELDERTLQSAYGRLASVLGPSGGDEIGVRETAEPLLAACRLVAEAQGIPPLRPPPEPGDAAPPAYRLGRICAASRIRHRRVILRDDWWRRDNGALLGFLTPEGEAKGPGRPEHTTAGTS